ncbi:MAG: hypothetical protein ABJK25_03050 [Halieaceae bacterium]
MDAEKFTKLLRSLLLAFGLAHLGGCLVTITHGSGGSVTSDMGANCSSIFCTYQIFEGESFSETFTAEPREGFEFVGWEDSLGDSLQICTNPTQATCAFAVTNLHPLFVGESLEIKARFQPPAAQTVNYILFEDSSDDEYIFVQKTPLDWTLISPDEDTYAYQDLVRTASSITLISPDTSLKYIVDFMTGSVTTQKNDEGERSFGSLISSSSKVSGYLVSEIGYGNKAGVYQGELIQLDKDTWSIKEKNSDSNLGRYSVVSRDRDTFTLQENESLEQLAINLESGVMSFKSAAGELIEEKFIHRASPLLDGFSVRQIDFADEAGNQLGTFIELNGETWSEVSFPGGESVEEYSLTNKTRDLITLQSKANTQRQVFLDIKDAKISERVRFYPTVELFQITKLR